MGDIFIKCCWFCNWRTYLIFNWLVINPKIEMHINRQDDDYENEKENKKKEDKE